MASALPADWESDRPLLVGAGHALPIDACLDRARRIAQALPDAAGVVNLCERRDAFILAFTAALLRGQVSLLPPSRAPAAVAEVMAAHPGCVVVDDATVEAALAGGAAPAATDRFPPHPHAVIGYTSGSTGLPKPNPKTWDSYLATTAHNAARIRAQIGRHEGTPTIVATVPPQHMYGMETSVLIPLLAGMAVHVGRPLFPADVAAALAEVPAPRVLVSTPVHLRSLVESGMTFPTVAVVVSATAPLDAALAGRVEAALGGPVLEMFGATETCVFATRRTSLGEDWHAYEGIALDAGEESTTVTAPWLPGPTVLQDVVESLADGRFRLRGRNSDLVEVAGKRASLADLTRRLLAIEGVKDAVVLQPADGGAGLVGRLAALVVAPTLSAEQLAAALAPGIDPVFMPRPMRLVEALPRNELGKLPRAALLELLRGA
ncbi:MAG: acyl-CoA synthetase [Gammaproteobacteria bacterium]|nr:acyl-CoA synthetase [Gammaproteobacteria bacterium]